jgi:hypothetical protein
MKQVAITILAVVGAYAVFQWYQAGANSNTGRGSHNKGPWPPNIQKGQGNWNVSSVTSGVPIYDTTPVEAGHGDQQAATKHSNPFSTVNGSSSYTPAFGPNENQPPNAANSIVVV